jgi:hypothetical protein
LEALGEHRARYDVGWMMDEISWTSQAASRRDVSTALDMTKRERLERNFLKKVGDYLVGIIILVTFAAVFY